MTKLITSEDPFHIHKTLGSLSAIHFIYRFYLACFAPDHDMGLASPAAVPWVMIHAALSMTSLFFHIPQNRVKGAPMIWPEFRLHSILFAMRSIVVILLEPMFGKYVRPASVIGTLFAADAVSAYYKKQGRINPDQTTMRNMPFPDNTPATVIKYINMFYSVSQVFATMNVLVHSHNAIFLTLFPIQFAAFWMTLVRKGFITSKQWHIFYTASLLSNYVYACMTSLDISSHIYRGVGLAFIIARFRFSVNKYALWAGTILILNYSSI